MNQTDGALSYSWRGVLCSPRTCKNPSLVSDCLILPHVSDSNMGFILYNYPSHGNDCISSFQTDNSIWTQVIRFLRCGWYLSIICPVKRRGMAGGFRWLPRHEILPLHSCNLAMFCTVHFPVPSSPQPPAWKDRDRRVNADLLWAHDKVQNQIADGLWSLNGINCSTFHFKNINVSQKTAQYDVKCHIFTIYRINQHPRQMGRDFCWLDTPTQWELGMNQSLWVYS